MGCLADIITHPVTFIWYSVVIVYVKTPHAKGSKKGVMKELGCNASKVRQAEGVQRSRVRGLKFSRLPL